MLDFVQMLAAVDRADECARAHSKDGLHDRFGQPSGKTIYSLGGSDYVVANLSG